MEIYHVDNEDSTASYYAVARTLPAAEVSAVFKDKMGFTGDGLLCSQLNELNETDTFSVEVEGPTFPSELKTPTQIRDRKASLGSDYTIYRLEICYARDVSLLRQLKTTIIDENDAEAENVTLVPSGAVRAFFGVESEETFKAEGLPIGTTFSPQLALEVTEFDDLVIGDATKSRFTLKATAATVSPGVTAEYNLGSLEEAASYIKLVIKETVTVDEDTPADLALVAIASTPITHYQ